MLWASGPAFFDEKVDPSWLYVPGPRSSRGRCLNDALMVVGVLTRSHLAEGVWTNTKFVAIGVRNNFLGAVGVQSSSLVAVGVRTVFLVAVCVRNVAVGVRIRFVVYVVRKFSSGCKCPEQLTLACRSPGQLPRLHVS